jgi:hypothetical protein
MTTSKRVLITQSNYIPWKGYFDLIAAADEMIILDSVQYTRRDWRNRNIIKTPNGPLWLTVPVEVKGKFFQAIDETRIASSDWGDAHIRSIDVNYRRAASFKDVSPWLFETLSAASKEPMLSKMNEFIIRAICTRLGIHTPIRRCTDMLDRDLMRDMDPTDRLLELCRSAGATDYISGPAAKDYMDVSKFTKHDITVSWADYSGYPEYPQLWGAFDHRVSIVDLLLNAGSTAAQFMKLNNEGAHSAS